MPPSVSNSRPALLQADNLQFGDGGLKILDSNKTIVQTSVDLDWMASTLLFLILSITVACYPWSDEISNVSTYMVWYCGWLTAVSTGLGALPFCFSKKSDDFWTGLSNGAAAGMMCAASLCLAVEGFSVENVTDHVILRSEHGVLLGMLGGIIFILTIKQFLDGFEDLKIGNLGKLDSEKVLLIMCVMTLHSFSEGVGIGVSFGGPEGHQLGRFISLSLAAHNIPEGVAVGAVMTSNGFSVVQSALWAILSSIPQPLMAIPAYIFVEQFTYILPIGLGFAAGAMAYVALFELLVEAVQDTKSVLITAMTSVIAFALMMCLQGAVKGQM